MTVAPTITKVDNTIVMASVESATAIYYTYKLGDQPTDPTSADDLYTAPIEYVKGYYKAIAIKTSVSSTVTKKSFEQSTFGCKPFIINYSSGTIIIQNRKGKVILEDYEDDESEIVADSGTRYSNISGQYLNPKIIIKKTDYAEWETQLKPLIGKVVSFTPYSDNIDFTFNCTVKSVKVLFKNGVFWRDYVEILLKSVDYTDVKAMP